MDVAKLDLYGILDVSPAATAKEIVKAYRKKALKCHPDKNPDNPKAVDLFHRLSKALEVLTDGAAKAAYDKILRAREAAKLRHRVLDGKRKKFKEDLEARENASENQKATDAAATRNLEAEIERLRKQGSRLLVEEQEKMQAELDREAERTSSKTTEALYPEELGAPRLKLRWKAKKTDETNGGYDQDYLDDVFRKYGEVTALLVSQKKKGSAIVEFKSTQAAVLAVGTVIGKPSNPLTISWLSGQPPEGSTVCRPPPPPEDSSACRQHSPEGSSAWRTDSPGFAATDSDDFENTVLLKMQRAQQEKRRQQEEGEQPDDKELKEEDDIINIPDV